MRIRNLIAVSMAISLVALPGSAAAPRSLQATNYRLPVAAQGTISSFFDPSYRATEDRQHLGIDLPAPAGTSVGSPVRGVVTFNNTGAGIAPDRAFLIIRETATGVEHVLGHIDSPIQPGTAAAAVAPGSPVGTVKRWVTPNGHSNSHVHWGANTRAIPRTIEAGPGGDWGWGRAPATVTEAQAAARGWINLNFMVSGAPRVAAPAPAPARAPAPPPRAASTIPSPEQVVRTLFADLAKPGSGYPLWWRSLSRRTDAQHRQLRGREQQTGDVILDYDWLCQCQDPEGITVQRVQVVTGPPDLVNVRVWFRNASGEIDNVTLAMINEGGWKIDDIIDRNGKHFRGALSRR